MRSIYLSVLFVGLIFAMTGATEARAIESDFGIVKKMAR